MNRGIGKLAIVASAVFGACLSAGSPAALADCELDWTLNTSDLWASADSD